MCTFLIIYLVFKNASKELPNKKKWLKIIKVLFVSSLATNISLAIFMNIRIKQAINSKLEKVERQFIMCDNPLWVINAGVELI